MKNYLLFIFTFFISIIHAQIPADYYEGTEGLTGNELRLALHDIIDDHIEYAYSDLRDFILKESDEDPNNTNNVILLYSGISRDKDDFGGNVGEWNREHTWAKSHGDFGNSPAEGTDAHHIRPTDVQINSTRGNLDFDNGGSPVSGCPGCKIDGDSFEPRDAVKGDVARMIFYMATRYMGGSGELFLNLVDEVDTAPDPLHGKLSTLLDWHEEDLPDAFEKNRNEVVFGYQENRNPFIDHPEFVDAIWGDPTSITEKLPIEFKVFPNPVVNELRINKPDEKNYSYCILNTSGIQINHGILSHGNSVIQMNSFADGLYLLVIQDENLNKIDQIKFTKTSR